MARTAVVSPRYYVCIQREKVGERVHRAQTECTFISSLAQQALQQRSAFSAVLTARALFNCATAASVGQDVEQGETREKAEENPAQVGLQRVVVEGTKAAARHSLLRTVSRAKLGSNTLRFPEKLVAHLFNRLVLVGGER